jgi:carboxyl-terminal processing protease
LTTSLTTIIKPIPGDKYPIFSTSDYQAFKQFIKAPKYSFETETELAFKNTLAIAKRKIRRKYYNRIPAITNRLKKRTNTGRQNQEEIKNIIIAEIIKRFQYEEYQYYIKTNSEIKKSVSILNNAVEYKNILKKLMFKYLQ